MSDRQDILLDDELDLRIEDGDFVVGNSTQQEIECLLRAAPGHYKQNPLLGANITQDLNGPMNGETRRRIRVALLADGFKIKDISTVNGVISIDAE